MTRMIRADTLQSTSLMIARKDIQRAAKAKRRRQRLSCKSSKLHISRHDPDIFDALNHADSTLHQLLLCLERLSWFLARLRVNRG